jgi:hypothetical protein
MEDQYLKEGVHKDMIRLYAAHVQNRLRMTFETVAVEYWLNKS